MGGMSATLPAQIGDIFYFTNAESGGSHENELYIFRIEETTDHTLTLQNDQIDNSDDNQEDKLGCKKSSECHIRVMNAYGINFNVYWDDEKDGISQGILFD